MSSWLRSTASAGNRRIPPPRATGKLVRSFLPRRRMLRGQYISSREGARPRSATKREGAFAPRLHFICPEPSSSPSRVRETECSRRCCPSPSTRSKFFSFEKNALGAPKAGASALAPSAHIAPMRHHWLVSGGRSENRDPQACVRGLSFFSLMMREAPLSLALIFSPAATKAAKKKP